MTQASRFGAALVITLVLSGCIDTSTLPVSYGPQSTALAVEAAKDDAIGNLNPLTIQVGEFVAIQVSQDLANGASFSIVGNAGETITQRDETPDDVTFSGVVHEIAYLQDGTYQKTSREGVIGCARKTVNGCKVASAAAPLQTQPRAAVPSIENFLARKKISSLKFTPVDKLVVAATTAAAPTFHSLKTWTTKELAPLKVRQEPNCLGLPNCQITMKHVSFDTVFWDEDPRGEKLHSDYQYSPDVPYFSNQMSLCQTLLASVGTSNILLKQCRDVYDFRFKN